MRKKIAAGALSALLAVAVLAGCGAGENGKTNTEAINDEDSSEDSETIAEITTPEDETDSDESAADEETTTYTYEGLSYGLDDNGFINDLTALDYVTLPDFTKVTFTADEIACTDDQMEEALESFCSDMATENYDRAVEDGDTVVIDYVGSVDGVEFDGGTADGQTVTAGSSDYIDDFLTQIIGHTPGETFDVNVTFPDPYTNNTDLSGKDAVFVTTIEYIIDTPAVEDITDEWIQENQDKVDEELPDENVTTLDDLKAYVTDYFEDYNLQQCIYDYLKSDDNVPVSEVAEDAYIVAYNQMDCQYYLNYGYTVEQIEEIYGEDTVTDQINSTARLFMIYQAIAEDQGWDIQESDFTEATGLDDNTSIIETYGKGYIAQMVIYYRCFDYLEQCVTVQ